MKKMVVLLLALLLAAGSASASEILHVEARDGVVLEGKLDLPEGKPNRLVVFVNGSGPNTYDNTRQLGEDTFRYYDLFAQRLTAGGAAFFRWSARGCSPGDEPPLYTEIDEALYQTYLPENSITDVEAVVRALKADERLADCPVYLLGWSEGTMIAPHVAARGNVPIDALVLCGYVNGTMMETLEWQQTGGASMVFYRQYFDADQDGAVTQAEFEADPYGLSSYLGGARFDQIDLDGSGDITEADFAMMLASGWIELRDAIERKDDAWLAENYPVRLTGAWFEGHAALSPNRDVLPELSLPIYILHGDCDANVPVQGVYDIQAAFEALGKKNLSARVYAGHDHDLNYAQALLGGELSDAFKDLFGILLP